MNFDKILVVDDELDILAQMNTFLSSEGYTVISASNGNEGLKSFMKHDPAISLFDYQMPGMNGLELLTKVKSEHPENEIIFISGHADMKVAVNAIKEHAFDFLPKPIDLSELLIKIEEAKVKIKRKQKIKAGNWVSRTCTHELVGKHNDTSLIQVMVELDEMGSPELERDVDRLIAKGVLRKNILCSLIKVGYINNIGLNALVSIHEKLTKNGNRLMITGLLSRIEQYIENLGYDSFFEIVKNTDPFLS